MLPFLFLLSLYGNLAQHQAAIGHPIDCVSNPAEAQCVYNLNK